MSANDQGIVAVTGRAHCQLQVAFLGKKWLQPPTSKKGWNPFAKFAKKKMLKTASLWSKWNRFGSTAGAVGLQTGQKRLQG